VVRQNAVGQSAVGQSVVGQMRNSVGKGQDVKRGILKLSIKRYSVSFLSAGLAESNLQSYIITTHYESPSKKGACITSAVPF
jgi:hypothetical protein